MSGSSLNKQEGGSHYKDLPIQPVEYIYANALGYFEGNVVKYVTLGLLALGIVGRLVKQEKVSGHES